MEIPNILRVRTELEKFRSVPVLPPAREMRFGSDERIARLRTGGDAQRKD